MDIGLLLKPSQIKLELQATDRWKSIEELAGFLAESGFIPQSRLQGVIHALRDREEKMSTGIGFNVAIPHATTDLVTELTAAYGRSQHGLAFDALDGQLVKHVLVLLVPKNQFQLHLRTLASLAKFLKEPATRDALDAARTVEEAYGVFAKATLES
ncbi:MAG: PTS sugar transporter subunit IIA [Verrucomicrobiota bacterium]|nr:PTS sugar transporter subunit IIA [Verrucomicrobiota bacterium]